MSTARKMICILVAGAVLGATAPVFADSWHDRGRDRDRYSRYDRHDHRYVHRGYGRGYAPRRVVVVERPVVIERRVQVYGQSPAPVIGVGAMIGAVIGGIYDSQQ